MFSRVIRKLIFDQDFTLFRNNCLFFDWYMNVAAGVRFSNSMAILDKITESRKL